MRSPALSRISKRGTSWREIYSDRLAGEATKTEDGAAAAVDMVETMEITVEGTTVTRETREETVILATDIQKTPRGGVNRSASNK